MATKVSMDKYKRRKFLLQARNLTYAGATGWLWGCGRQADLSTNLQTNLQTNQPSNDSEEKQQVIVVGAGIAGIAAAQKLHSLGYRVVVLEGRDRIGGRIWTDNSLGVPLDLGAAWIHKIDGNPISTLVKQFGIQTVISDYDSQWNYQDVNQLLDESDERLANQAFRAFMARVTKLKNETSPSQVITLADIAQEIIQSEKLSGVALKAFQARLASTIESEMGESLAHLGIKGFNEDSEFTGANVVFPQGYTQLVQALSKDLDIRIKHLVQQITYDENAVEVKTDRGIFRGSQVIVTVPLGVLKHGSIEFVPTLPEAKLLAIKQLGMGALNKLVLKFSKQFWRSEPHYMAYINGNRNVADRYIDFWNWQKYVQQPILVALVSGDFSRSLFQRSLNDVSMDIMSDLQAMFGKNIELPTTTLLTKWHDDPFAYGSYSTFSVNGNIQDCDRLAEPIGDRIFFAGEATYGKYLGTVHGAFLSGEREANRIAKLDQ